MDDKRKVVLGSEDIKVKQNEDIFLNINLSRTFNHIKKDKYENIFDLAEQFRRERNASRNFRVYGIVQSTVIDPSLLVQINAYSDSGLTQQVATTVTTPLGLTPFGNKNVYGFKRGKYLLEIDDYTDSDFIWIKIDGNGVNTTDEVYIQQLVFSGADGNYIEYGTQTVDVGFNGEAIPINNDFPFLYNKHWIKKDLNIREIKQRDISFQVSSYTIEEGGEPQDIVVSLNSPSVFGNESVDVILTTPTVETFHTAAPDIDFRTTGSTFPITLNWGIGETDQIIKAEALSDFKVENFVELFTLQLTNPINATIGQGQVSIQSSNVGVVDLTEKRTVNYNFQNIVNNYTPLTHGSTLPADLLPAESGYNMNIWGATDDISMLSNYNEYNQNFRYYPNDNFTLKITNEGESTTLPVIQGVTTNEQFLGANQSITLDITSNYQDFDLLAKEIAVLEFNNEDGIGIIGISSYIGPSYINGISIPPTLLVAENFYDAVVNRFASLGLPMPFDMVRNGRDITFTAKHPAININIKIPKSLAGNIYALRGSSESPVYPNGRVENITTQIPLVLPLYANESNGTFCKYRFEITKNGYKDLVIPAESIQASVNGEDAYLVSGIRDLKGPSLPFDNADFCDPSTSQLDVNGYYLNGAALIAGSVPGYSVSSAKNAIIPFFAPQFRPSPLTTGVNNCYNLIDISKVLS
jgi:hypothetical protein